MAGEHGGWVESAQAWIESQGETGDSSRREILDPCLEKLIGDVSGLRVLDVGCGEGRYCRILDNRGAIVTGMDPVESLIDHARSFGDGCSYVVAGGEAIPLEDRSFDLVLSYLTIIDIPDYRAAIGEMCRLVKPKGRIVIVTVSNMASTSIGWIKDENGRKLHRPVDRYMEEFSMDLEWSDIRVVNFHRPMSAILEPFFQAGMALTNFLEPLPSRDSSFFTEEFRVPTFQVLVLERREDDLLRQGI